MRAYKLIGICFLSSFAFGDYRQLRDGAGIIRTDAVQRIEDRAFIPADINNKDYVEYLQWEKAGNKLKAPEDQPAPTGRDAQKVSARLVTKSATATTDQKINALLLILDLDR